jgi:hypothetical protein
MQTWPPRGQKFNAHNCLIAAAAEDSHGPSDIPFNPKAQLEPELCPLSLPVLALCSRPQPQLFAGPGRYANAPRKDAENPGSLRPAIGPARRAKSSPQGQQWPSAYTSSRTQYAALSYLQLHFFQFSYLFSCLITFSFPAISLVLFCYPIVTGPSLIGDGHLLPTPTSEAFFLIRYGLFSIGAILMARLPCSIQSLTGLIG